MKARRYFFTMLFVVVGLSAAPFCFAAPSLTSPVVVQDLDTVGTSSWDSTSTFYDEIWYSWTATTTRKVCAVSVPISRRYITTPGDHEIPILVGIVSDPSLNPTNSTFLTNTNFSSAFYSDDYPVADAPVSNESAYVYFTVVPGGDTLSCQNIQAGETIWIKIWDMGDLMPAAAPMRFGHDQFGLGNTGSRVCYGIPAPTSTTTCQADGSGAIKIWDDASVQAFDLVFDDPVADYTFTDEQGGLAHIFQEMLKWLFVPSDASTAYYSDALGTLTSKVPFGYFTSTTQALEELGDASSTTGNLDLTVPMAGGDFATPTIRIIDLDAIAENDTLQNIFAIIRTIFSIAIGCAMMLFLWHEITSHRHLDG